MHLIVILIIFSFHILERNELPANILWQSKSWEHVAIKTAEIKNLEQFMGGIFPAKYKIDNDDGWILDISFNRNETSTIDDIEKLNSKIQSSLDGGVLGLKANVVPLDFIFSTNLIEFSLYVNQQKALQAHNHIVIDV